VYAINASAVENLDRNSKNKNIYIVSDSQAAIKEFDKHQLTSKLVWDCHQSLTQLAKYNRVQLIWVPGYEGIVGNEMADQLARKGSEHPFIGPEPACGISIGVAKKAVRDLTNINHKKILGTYNCTETGSSRGRKKDLLKLNRDQLRWVVGLLTGHCHLKGHLFKLGLTDDPICEKCLEEDESAP
jgi:hypothetical protein